MAPVPHGKSPADILGADQMLALPGSKVRYTYEASGIPKNEPAEDVAKIPD